MDLHSTTLTSGPITDVNKPVFSLCIPTYNRKEKLARLVNGVLANLQKASGKIEICISDNASIDGTDELLKEFSACKYINVFRQSENKGFDKNYVSVFSMARGKYVWILGDDDTIVENGMEKILQLLQNESPDYAYVHIASTSSDSPNYFQHIKPGKYSEKTLHSMLCKDGLDMFGFIGSHIFQKSALNILTSSDDKLYNGWPHLALLFAASDNLKSFLVTEPLARQISDGLFWSSTNWVLVNMKKIDILDHYKPKWADKNFKYFFIIKKTFLSKSSITNLVHAKILEPDRFSEIADKAYSYFKKSKGTLKFTIFIYLIFIFFIKYLPIGFILSKFNQTYYRNKMKEYEDMQREKAPNEGYSREPSI